MFFQVCWNVYGIFSTVACTGINTQWPNTRVPLALFCRSVFHIYTTRQLLLRGFSVSRHTWLYINMINIHGYSLTYRKVTWFVYCELDCSRWWTKARMFASRLLTVRCVFCSDKYSNLRVAQNHIDHNCVFRSVPRCHSADLQLEAGSGGVLRSAGRYIWYSC